MLYTLYWLTQYLYAPYICPSDKHLKIELHLYDFNYYYFFK